MLSKKIKPGSLVWVPCEVQPGPFSNERVALVHSKEDMLGFVQVQDLQDPSVITGKTNIVAEVYQVNGEEFKAYLPGEFFTGKVYTGKLSDYA